MIAAKLLPAFNYSIRVKIEQIKDVNTPHVKVTLFTRSATSPGKNLSGIAPIFKNGIRK